MRGKESHMNFLSTCILEFYTAIFQAMLAAIAVVVVFIIVTLPITLPLFLVWHYGLDEKWGSFNSMVFFAVVSVKLLFLLYTTARWYKSQ
jgi:hypothetical protein